MEERFMKFHIEITDPPTRHIPTVLIDTYPDLVIPGMSEQEIYIMSKLLTMGAKPNHLFFPTQLLRELISRLMLLEEQCNREGLPLEYTEEQKAPNSEEDNPWGTIS